MSVPRKPGEVRWRYDHLCTPKQYSCSQLSIDFWSLSISRLKPYSIDPLNGIPSYCDTICCDGGTEETCYDYDEDGKLNQYCAAVRFSLHTTTTISWTTWWCDSKCSVLILSTPTEAARVPKARRSVLRVSATFNTNRNYIVVQILTLCAHTLSDPLNGIASYCAIVCCDSIKEQICIDYDEDGYVNQYCAAVSVWSHLHLCCTIGSICFLIHKLVFDLHRLPMVDALAPTAKRIALVRLDYLQSFNMLSSNYY